jgi:hypothetical protein
MSSYASVSKFSRSSCSPSAERPSFPLVVSFYPFIQFGARFALSFHLVYEMKQMRKNVVYKTLENTKVLSNLVIFLSHLCNYSLNMEDILTEILTTARTKAFVMMARYAHPDLWYGREKGNEIGRGEKREDREKKRRRGRGDGRW